MKQLIKKWKNKLIAMSVDFLMIPIAWLLACLLYSDPTFTIYALTWLPMIMLIQAITCYACGLYRGMWRFASIPDLIRIIKAVFLGVVFIISLLHITVLNVPGSVPLLYGLLLLLFFSGSRILFRWLKEHRNLFFDAQRVLVVGAGSAGEGLVRDLRRLPYKKYQPIGFVDDDPTRFGCEVQGIRILGTCADIPILVSKLNIQLILIAVPSANSVNMRRIVGFCEKAQIPFRTLPGIQELADGTVNLSALRQVLLEDLLGREQATLDWQHISLTIADKVVLVTGGGGSIGSELCRQLIRQAPKRLVILDHNEFNLYAIELELKTAYPAVPIECFLCDIKDHVAVERIFSDYHPEIVFHAAAYKHVPLLENQLRIAVQNNIIGTRIIGEAAARHLAKKFILISTDKAVNPTNIMGATKRASEVFCQNMNFYSTTQFTTVRFGNVLESAGSVVPLFRKQLSQGGPLTVTHPEITRFFMTIPEASQLILQAAAMGNGGEIFVLDMGEPIKIRYLAEQMIKLSGKILGKDIQIHYTGLRPGEKLYEELFHEHETLTTTAHQKIRSANVRRLDWIMLLGMFDAIEVACQSDDIALIRENLSLLVPEYKIKSSDAIFKKNALYQLREKSELNLAESIL